MLRTIWLSGKPRETRDKRDYRPWAGQRFARASAKRPACFKYIHKIIRILIRIGPARRFPHRLQKRDIGITTDIVGPPCLILPVRREEWRGTQSPHPQGSIRQESCVAPYAISPVSAAAASGAHKRIMPRLYSCRPRESRLHGGKDAGADGKEDCSRPERRPRAAQEVTHGHAVAIGEDMDIAGFGASISSRQAAMKARHAFTGRFRPWPSMRVKRSRPAGPRWKKARPSASRQRHAVDFENLEASSLSRSYPRQRNPRQSPPRAQARSIIMASGSHRSGRPRV